MKNLILLAVFFTLHACTQKDRSVWDSFMVTESPQKFLVHTNNNAIIKGGKGTIIEIESNSFVDRSGKEVDEVLFVLEEFYSVSDFIKNNLTAQTVDGKLLRSSGMINIRAENDGKEVFLKKDITVKFPRVQFSRVANLFEGGPGRDGEILWNPLEQIHKDTSFFRTELIEQEEYGEEKVTVFIEIVVGNDTLDYSKENYDTFKDYIEKHNVEKIEKWNYYTFVFKSLGYINCDIFIDKEIKPLVVSTNKKDCKVYVVIDSLNSALYGKSINQQRNIFSFLRPVDLPITVMAYSEDGKETYFKLTKIKSETDTVMVDLIQTDPKDIRLAIESLR